MKKSNQAAKKSYDAIVVGAGVAGCAMAYAFALDGLNVLLMERNWSEPDRIVGELLQPGGVESLEEIGFRDVFNGIDAVDVNGYTVLNTKAHCVLPYGAKKGKSFHHGRFVMQLRHKCQHPLISMVCSTVTQLIIENNVVFGIKTKQITIRAPLVIVADGCFSKFRPNAKPTSDSKFYGYILKNARVPYRNYGHVFIQNESPVLIYQISSSEYRVLIDVPNTQKKPIEKYVLEDIIPCFPDPLKAAMLECNLCDARSMPNYYLPPLKQTLKQCFVIGDAYNMRHPLTGSGMSVALSDVILIRNLYRQSKLEFQWFFLYRKSYSMTLNFLANGLYRVFSKKKHLLNQGAFKYLCLGGKCTTDPIKLLSGTCPNPFLLGIHYFLVVFYSSLLSNSINFFRVWIQGLRVFFVLFYDEMKGLWVQF